MPLTIGLGLKELLARGRRALLLAAAIALTGAVVVIALSVDATLDAQPAGKTSDVPDELPLLIYTLDATLLLIAATTLVAVALLSVRERIRDYGVLKAIGLTPRQVTSTVVSAHAALAVVASLLAIPLGVGLYLALYGIASGHDRGRGRRTVVVARPDSGWNRARRRRRDQPPSTASHTNPHRRRAPLRVMRRQDAAQHAAGVADTAAADSDGW